MRIKNILLPLLLSLFCLNVCAEENVIEASINHYDLALKGEAVYIGSVGENLIIITNQDQNKTQYQVYTQKNAQSNPMPLFAESQSTLNPYVSTGFLVNEQGIFQVGGQIQDKLQSDVLMIPSKTMEKIHQLPKLPLALKNPIVEMIGKTLIVTGGEDEKGLNKKTWGLNLGSINEGWGEFASLPYNSKNQCYCVVQNGGDEDYLYLFGDKTLAYSLKQNKWRDLTDIAEAPIDVRGQFPVSLGTHHILFFDPQGNYCTYHTVTGQWDSKQFIADRSSDTFVCMWNEEYMMLNDKQFSQISFTNNVSFGFLNYTVLLGYLVAMLLIGVYFSRRTTTSDDFFTGGGRIPWWASGISIFATSLSAITFMAIPAKTYTSNWLYFPMAFSILLVAPIVIHWYLPFFRGLKLTCAYEYLEYRFNLTVRMLSSCLFIIFMITRIGIVLYLPSVALSTVTGIDLMACIMMMSIVTIIYSTMGGVEAVIWGDVIQGFILVGGAIISAVFIVIETGGIGETMTVAMDADKFKMLDMSFDFTQPTFWVMFLGAGIANSLITYTSDQTIIQRYLTTDNMKKTKSSIWLNGIISLPIIILFYFIGTALFSYFYVHPENLPITMSNSEGIFPYFIVNELPAGVAGLLIAAIFSATMSTLSSNINSASTAISVDFAKRLKNNLTDKQIVNIARISGVIVGLLGTYLAIELSQMKVKSFFDEFNTFIGLLTSGLGGLFAIGIFLPRVRGYAALIGLILSVFILLWMRSHSPMNFMMYGFMGIILSMIIALIFSYILPEKPKDLSKLTWKTRTNDELE